MQDEAAWRAVFSALALVARHDPRGEVADTAVASLLTIVKQCSQEWTQELWELFWDAGLQYVLALPSYTGSFPYEKHSVSVPHPCWHWLGVPHGN